MDDNVSNSAPTDDAVEEQRRRFMALEILQPPADWEGRLRMFESERGAINQAPFVVQGLTSGEARNLLLQGLSRGGRLADGCAFTAIFVTHGFALGNGQAAQMSGAYLRRVRRVLSEEDALAVIAAARATSGLLSDYVDRTIQDWAAMPSRERNWPLRDRGMNPAVSSVPVGAPKAAPSE